jgi:hypothetical protein
MMGDGVDVDSVTDEQLIGARRAVEALADGATEMDASAADIRGAADAGERGYFRPEEESVLLDWFARFLTVRFGLWEVLEEISGWVVGDLRRIRNDSEWRCFVLGYAAACLIVRLDRALLERVATDPVTQRKLNEGSAEHRIPRKQYTAIFESFTDPVKAIRMEQAMRFAQRHRRRLQRLTDDPVVGAVATRIENWERVLDPSRRRYLQRLLSFIVHTFRRRGASVQQQALFAALEAGGRVMSELHDRWAPDRVDDDIRRQVDALLRPGDVIVARHDRAVTNLFLPGFWPHAALYVGTEADRMRLQVSVDAARAERWSGDRRVLEALKDGVLFRPLEQTLAVDAVAVIRPNLDDEGIAEALARVAEHEGKLYNFDFDFFRSDRLVCTEVVYRAYDGLGPIRIPLRERTGRPTLSAEDLLDLAVEGEGFEPVAVFGAPTCPDRLIEGEDARAAIRDSYRSTGR